jgi:hypothetical protein
MNFDEVHLGSEGRCGLIRGPIGRRLLRHWTGTNQCDERKNQGLPHGAHSRVDSRLGASGKYHRIAGLPPREALAGISSKSKNAWHIPAQDV